MLLVIYNNIDPFLFVKKYEEKIVDSSIDSDQMSKINGSFAPYFENLTSALLFCWVQKHNICKFI